MPPRLDVGAVLSRTFEIYVEQAPVLMPAAAAVFVVTGLLYAVLVQAGPGLALLGALIRLIATLVFTGMIVELVADVRDGRRDATVGKLLRGVTPVLWQLVAVSVIAAALITLGLFVFLVPGLVLLTIWSVFVPVIVLERPPGFRALGRSRELVRGNGWRVFGLIVLVALIVAVVPSAITLAAGAASEALGLVVAVVLGVLTAPIAALALSVLYFDLLRSAVPEPEPVAPAGADEA